MQQVKAKKALGQHFLTDLSVAQRIADTVSEYKGSPVLEVGPGMGVLTQFLLQAGHDLTVVELDTESVDYLNAVYPDELRDRIVSADFLKLDLKQTLGDGKMVIIGNYPYNISSQIFFKVLDYKDQVVCCSGMLQREVAQRIAAGPGSKTYGILSVLLGGISNQWDRLRRGSVTDYLQFPHRKAKKRALVWNLADFMLIGGVVLTVAGLVKELIKK